ncbi:MAG: hypothetical protein AAFP89_15855 [Bacteroidota bacterium]
MKKHILLFILLPFVMSIGILCGQPSISAPGKSDSPVEDVQIESGVSVPGLAKVENESWLSSREFYLSVLILGFGLLLVLLTLLASRIGGIQMTADEFLRLISIILIINSSLLLISSGFSDKQISSVIGLLGTLAGYLLGRRESKSASK